MKAKIEAYFKKKKKKFSFQNSVVIVTQEAKGKIKSNQMNEKNP